jgi:hypothetical protein
MRVASGSTVLPGNCRPEDFGSGTGIEYWSVRHRRPAHRGIHQKEGFVAEIENFHTKQLIFPESFIIVYLINHFGVDEFVFCRCGSLEM